MVPTERALALQGPVRTALATLESALETPGFDPARAQRSFVVATTDFVELVLLPRLMARLQAQAPGVSLQLASWPYHRVPPGLEAGELDLMIGFYPDVPPAHHQQLLFPDHFVCIVRRGHPRVRRRLTLKTYASLPHILVSSAGQGPGVVDQALARVGLSRTVALRMSHFLMVPSLVAATDCVAAVSQRVAKAFAGPLGLQVFPPPLPLPRGTVGQVWHQRTHASPAHAWLRAQVAEAAREV